MKKLLFPILALVLVLALALPVAAQVEPPVKPPVVEDELAPGDSLTVIKEVTTPPIPPNPDIYFMADTTGSMVDVIGAVQGNVDAIMAAILLAQPTAQFGVGNYKDYPVTVPPFTNQLAITDNTSDVSTAIGNWAAGGGGDWPEGQFYALDRLADGTGIGWRGIGTKIVVWFGDAPAHDPVPVAATGLGDDITETTVTADLVAAGIKVIAISINTTDVGSPYPDGTDDDPTVGGGDYAAAYGIIEDGTAGQATRIATATGGAYLFAATPEEAVAAVLEGIEALTTDVWWEVTACDPGLTVTLDPIVRYDVPGGTTVEFAETITVANDPELSCGILDAMVAFYANSHPDTEGALVGTQEIIIHVLDVAPPVVECVESVNPHGKNIPPAGKTTLPGPKGGQNEDGFYELLATDNCDDPANIIEIYVSGFGPFASGTVVKFTEAPGAAPSMKKIGSSKGQAGAVICHIILPTDPVVTAVDAAGNVGTCTCFVPPPPK